ncbi:MAG: beta-N-acetylhexosaminidase [Planctomycetota bacterium]|nr:beta-N-acetylhexosaminidase [Planctomycetota bacterium]MDA1106340.1 beta-N-acetylhexosaminidase [Planctomycetota bacterium]
MDPVTARRLAASCLCIGFDGLGLPDGARSLIAAGVRNLILFTRNIRDRAQLAQLIDEIQSAAGTSDPSDRVLISVDQEGGRVQRLGIETGVRAVPSMREIGTGADPESRASAIATQLAEDLRSLGFGLDFAPVVDVDTNPGNPVIGDRSFSRDPAVVSRCASAFIRAMQSRGVAACAKHFPGHGDTAQDSHLELPRLPHAMERLREIELPPFRAAIDAGVSCIMTAHVLFEAIDPAVPATMSARVLSGLLREELKFQGVIITDCLEMQAIADRFDLGDAAVRAIRAGADLALCCHTLERQKLIIDRLTDEATRDDWFANRLTEAASRVGTLCAIASRGFASTADPERGCSA